MMDDKPRILATEFSHAGLYNAGDQSIHFNMPANPEPVAIFRPDGTVEVRGDAYEAAKLFWDYVKIMAAREYKKHASTHHEIRDLGELVAERKGRD